MENLVAIICLFLAHNVSDENVWWWKWQKSVIKGIILASMTVQ